jgi:S-adenosylmethionine/arginine decarboxylase-like enzyme
MIEHKHIIIRAEVNNFFDKFQEQKFSFWIKDLINNLGMNLLSGPHLVYVNKPGLEGWTGVSIIETSHIAVHVWDAKNPILVQLDVYTCGSLNPSVVFDSLKQFNPTKIEFKLLDREHSLKDL